MLLVKVLLKLVVTALREVSQSRLPSQMQARGLFHSLYEGPRAIDAAVLVLAVVSMLEVGELHFGSLW